MDLYTRNALNCSEITTKNYSTSFSMGVRLLGKEFRPAVYAIYGFVRFADEIVDTFHHQDKANLLQDFTNQCWEAIEKGISTNPILHSFQWAVNTYHIDHKLIEAFLLSMEMDLEKKTFSAEDYKRYIYGSAEVVGLMCLKVFYSQNQQEYDLLVPPARKLGEAFQKVNFLRDMLSDKDERGRVYFPGVDFQSFDKETKAAIEADIQKDFDESVSGIRGLNNQVRLGVFLAYSYYLKLLKKIKKTPPQQLVEKRIRVNDFTKLWLLIACHIKHKWGMI